MRTICSLIVPAVFSVVALFGMVMLPAPSHAQSVTNAQPQQNANQTDSSSSVGGKEKPTGEGGTDSDPAAGSKGATESTIQTGDDENAKFEVGRIIFPTYEFELGKKRLFYGLYLPKNFVKSKTYPLVVVLHGLNGSPGQILAYPGLTKYADNEGYILVAPMGYNSRGWYGSRGKGGGRGSDPRNLGELSEQDVMEVLKLTRKNFKIDPERIYLFGHSMGGGGSMHLAMTYPQLWAAIAVIAPAAYGNRDRLATAKDIPAYVVQGDRDRLVSVRQTRLWVEKMRELGMKHEYVEVKNGGHVFLAWQHFAGIFSFFAANPKTASP
jgi:poly(3-hydroxybutyrate) depolymerase